MITPDPSTGLGQKWSSHAAMDLRKRRQKAVKIERLLGLDTAQGPIRMLEIGTGSGGIAGYFGHHETLDFEVHSVDVVDQRQETDGYLFHLVEGTHLPFPNSHFDVVLSNHVIEHVGGRSDQVSHLKELHRVLRIDGIAYLATPNRWAIMEPHFKLLFLSWLPRKLRTVYVRWWRKSPFYDCEPLSGRELRAVVSEAGLFDDRLEVSALRVMAESEGGKGSLFSLLVQLPDAILARLVWVSPTLVRKLSPR